MKQIARESQNLSVPEIKQACFFPSGRFLWISSNLPKIAYSLLVLHILSVAVLGFFELPGWFSYLATLPGLFAVPLVSWHLVRKTELLYSRLFKKTYVASSATILSGIILIACIPALFDFFSSLSLDLIGRLLELTTIVISVAVMSGLVLIAIGLADFIFLATNQFHRFSQKLILLLVVTGFGTFFWLSFVGVQIHSVLEWAIKQGHLEVYTVGLEELSQSSGLYIQGIAGALSMEIPFLIILAWRFGNRATSGISLISEGLNRVSHGDYTTKIVVSGNDEIGAIQQGFNEMLDATAEKSFLEKTFGQYVSPQVLETIRMNGREAMIQSERKNGTVVFTDICGFTAM
ncbi:MAG: HAMP domain-containing protein, partial [Gammaproteobacteria bacterium]|nr:HAMP domain-containing protein [Gammaproteobacteria bacterium]